ncbi:NADPH-dependent FMN reductase [Bdellovibrio bacteriovorus]|uniref:NADPH-dependent FMN reductase n=1 Tax=Bdellovibrio bacteriovorus TaxID=959 RepID=UPI00045BECF0|nr:NAD(P)H-dependent oxidoreductase [Bdellovibrio bacteriovorus]AHZ84272.1 alpha-glucosidase [Bdellovibrio bacteriovorus]BEV68160.1 Quinone reductase [Bdellovibrio bacteriovorus]
MKVFMFAASLRHGSYNKKLIRVAAESVMALPFCEVELHEFNEFPLPMYDADLESTEGIPVGALTLGKMISDADAVIISSPEYNGSIPGTFKNAIDWLSRIKPVPLSKKQILLIGASPGHLGGVRGNLHARVPLHILGSYVYPEYFGLAKADQAFDQNDQIKDEKQFEKLQTLLTDFIHYASRKETPFERLTEFVDEKLHERHN